VGPFLILSKVGKQAYEMQIPEDWKIHPIVSVAQLEPFREDSFDRELPRPTPVTIEGEEYYRIERVIECDMRCRGRNRRLTILYVGKVTALRTTAGYRRKKWSSQGN